MIEPTLRCWRPADAQALRRALDESDAHLRPWVPFMRHEPRSMAETAGVIDRAIAEFTAGPTRRFALWLDDALVGEVMIMDRLGSGTVELGYWVHVDACGRGIATTACRAAVAIAFADPAVEAVHFKCDAANGPSNRVPEKLGAHIAGTEAAAGLGDPPEPVTLNVWRLERPGNTDE